MILLPVLFIGLSIHCEAVEIYHQFVDGDVIRSCSNPKSCWIGRTPSPGVYEPYGFVTFAEADAYCTKLGARLPWFEESCNRDQMRSMLDDKYYTEKNSWWKPSTDPSVHPDYPKKSPEDMNSKYDCTGNTNGECVYWHGLDRKWYCDQCTNTWSFICRLPSCGSPCEVPKNGKVCQTADFAFNSNTTTISHCIRGAAEGENAEFAYEATYEADAECQTGYHLVVNDVVATGAETVTCSGGSWSKKLECWRACTILAISNTYLTSTHATVTAGYNHVMENEVVKYACLAGYTAQNPAGNEATCDSTGSFTFSSLPPLSCDPTPCTAVSFDSAVSNVAYDDPSFAVGAQATLTCNTGYQLNGNTTATCEVGPTWTNLGTCDPVPCVAMNSGPLSGTASITYSDGSYSVGSVATLTCAAGYQFTGGQPTSATCQLGPAWSDVLTACSAIPCTPLSYNATRSSLSYLPTDYSVGAVATLTCNAEYSMVGSATATCQLGPTWSNTLGSCEPDPCTAIDATPLGTTATLSYSDGSYSVGTVATLTCAAGYQFTGGQPTSATCQVGPAWSDVLTACSAIPCTPLSYNATTSSLSYLPTDYSVGAVATLTCNAEYSMVGSATATCQLGPTWSNTLGSCGSDPCTAMDATPLGTTATLSYSDGSYSVGTVATLTCAAGYQFTGGQPTSATCQLGPAWSDVLTACSAIPCTPLSYNATTSSLSYLPTDYSVGAVATLTCNAEYAMVGSATATCQLGPSWNDTLGSCEPDPCASVDPAIGSTATVSYSATPHSVDSTATVACKTGYELQPGQPSTAVCQLGPTWSVSLVPCTRVCSLATGVTTSVSAPYYAGDTISAECDSDSEIMDANSGMPLATPASATCQSDGTWLPDLSCQKSCQRHASSEFDQVSVDFIYYVAGDGSVLEEMASYAKDTIATLMCKSGFSKSDKNTTSYCRRGGWDPPLSKECGEEMGMSELQAIIAKSVQTLGCAYLLGIIIFSMVVALVFKQFTHERLLQLMAELSLTIAHFFVLAVRDYTGFGENLGNPSACRVIAALMQYFFTVHFAFFFLASLHSFALLTNLSSKQYFPVYGNLALGWGLPVIPILAMRAASEHYSYYHKFTCWLNFGSTALYAILIPIGAFGFAGMALSEAAAMDHQQTLPVKNVRKRKWALVTNSSQTLLIGWSLAAYVVGSYTCYAQEFSLFIVVFWVNIVLGYLLFQTHVMADARAQALVHKIFCCKKKSNKSSKVSQHRRNRGRSQRRSSSLDGAPRSQTASKGRLNLNYSQRRMSMGN